MKKISFLIVMICVTGLFLFANGEGETSAPATAAVQDELFISIIAHNDVTNPYQAVIGNGVRQAGIDFGVKVEYVAPSKMNVIEQMALIDGALAKGADGLGVMVADPDALLPKIKDITGSGTPVVLFQGGAQVWNEAGALAFIGGDSYSDGQFVAKHLIDAYDCKNIAIINHVQGELNIEVRDAGFLDYAKAAGVKHTEILTDVTDVEKTAAALKAAFLLDPTIDGVTGAWCGITGQVIVPVLEELGMLDQVTVGIMDFTPEYLKLIKQGKVQFSTTLQQWTNGYYAVAFLVNKIRYGVAPTGVVLTGPFIIDDSNVDVILGAVDSGSGVF